MFPNGKKQPLENFDIYWKKTPPQEETLPQHILLPTPSVLSTSSSPPPNLDLETSSYNVSLSDNGKSQIDSYYEQIKFNIDSQNLTLNELGSKSKELSNKRQIQVNQLKEIEDKEKLLLTRSRMLQISQDRSIYKKKIIYSLLAFILIAFILCLIMYVLFIRKKK